MGRTDTPNDTDRLEVVEGKTSRFAGSADLDTSDIDWRATPAIPEPIRAPRRAMLSPTGPVPVPKPEPRSPARKPGLPLVHNSYLVEPEPGAPSAGGMSIFTPEPAGQRESAAETPHVEQPTLPSPPPAPAAPAPAIGWEPSASRPPERAIGWEPSASREPTWAPQDYPAPLEATPEPAAPSWPSAPPVRAPEPEPEPQLMPARGYLVEPTPAPAQRQYAPLFTDQDDEAPPEPQEDPQNPSLGAIIFWSMACGGVAAVIGVVIASLQAGPELAEPIEPPPVEASAAGEDPGKVQVEVRKSFRKTEQQ